MDILPMASPSAQSLTETIRILRSDVKAQEEQLEKQQMSCRATKESVDARGSLPSSSRLSGYQNEPESLQRHIGTTYGASLTNLRLPVSDIDSQFRKILSTRFEDVFALDVARNIIVSPPSVNGVPCERLSEEDYYFKMAGWNTFQDLKYDAIAIQVYAQQIEKDIKRLRDELDSTQPMLGNQNITSGIQHQVGFLRRLLDEKENILLRHKTIQDCRSGPLKLFHPNQILAKNFIPTGGLCTIDDETLYLICLCLNDLQRLKVRNIIKMQPFDFLRWRIGVVLYRLGAGFLGPDGFKSVCRGLCGEGIYSDDVMRQVREMVDHFHGG
ncbi:hypothetical protein ACJ41O_012285 [Fusarium nematophilum]